MNQMYPHIVFLFQSLCQMLRTINRSMLTSGTTESHLQIGKIALYEPFYMMIYQFIYRLQEGQDLAILLEKINNRLIQTG